jgi:hypothetical protein
MRIAWPDVTLALEKHEPLRPIAVGILLAHHPEQQVAYRRQATEREK